MYRFIEFSRYDPYFKTGLNKALIESVRKENRPVVFLSGWNKKCVNLGYSQKFEEQVNTDEFQQRDDVVLVRRQGGGGTTYLTPKGEITWGIIAKDKEFPDDVNKIYRDICGKIAEGLQKLGIDASHEPINDLVTGKGKISGATLKQEDCVTYVGGTLLYDVDVEEMFSLITPAEVKKKDKQIEEHRDRVTTVKAESEVSFDQTVEALKKGLLRNLEYEVDQLKSSEIKRAEELANKYSSQEWLYRK